jgi:hypothetical protein
LGDGAGGDGFRVEGIEEDFYGIAELALDELVRVVVAVQGCAGLELGQLSAENLWEYV